MKTKTRRDQQLRCIAQLCAQARLNVGYLTTRGHVVQAAAWQDMVHYLQWLALYVRDRGLPVQPTLWEGVESAP